MASADGVGTKLKVAQLADKYDTVGQDLVNHCVNDILVQGAKPLFFLDYFAAGKLVPERLASVVEGLGTACRENGCALLGGETAEMPGLYAGEDFDLAGFIVGSVRRDQLLPRGVAAGDVLLGLPSTGLHTNGYSLARRLFFEQMGLGVHDRVEELGATVGEALLAVHRSYLKPLKALLESPAGAGVTALAHITGGGILDNLPRVLPEGVQAFVDPRGWEEPPHLRHHPPRGARARRGHAPHLQPRRGHGPLRPARHKPTRSPPTSAPPARSPSPWASCARAPAASSTPRRTPSSRPGSLSPSLSTDTSVEAAADCRVGEPPGPVSS